MTRHFLVPLVLVTLCACSRNTVATWNPVVRPGSGPKFAAFVQAQLDSVKRADPEADARTRMQAGDSAVLALQGFVPYVPGFAPELEPLLKRHGMHLIEPGCEVMYTDTQGEFCMAAKEYALRYNTIVIRALRATPQ